MQEVPSRTFLRRRWSPQACSLRKPKKSAPQSMQQQHMTPSASPTLKIPRTWYVRPVNMSLGKMKKEILETNGRESEANPPSEPPISVYPVPSLVRPADGTNADYTTHLPLRHCLSRQSTQPPRRVSYGKNRPDNSRRDGRDGSSCAMITLPDPFCASSVLGGHAARPARLDSDSTPGAPRMRLYPLTRSAVYLVDIARQLHVPTGQAWNVRAGVCPGYQKAVGDLLSRGCG